MEIKIIEDTITRKELISIADKQFGDLVKAVVDVEREIMAIGGELHADEEAELIGKKGSDSKHLWGINLYPQKLEGEWIEFDSMINIKPSLGNRSREVENEETRQKIKNIVQKLIVT